MTLSFVGAFTGGEIFGIIVGTFGAVGVLYVGYTKRYDIEYAVSSRMPTNNSYGNGYSGDTGTADAVNIPTTSDTNEVVSVSVNESAIDSVGVTNPSFDDALAGYGFVSSLLLKIFPFQVLYCFNNDFLREPWPAISRLSDKICNPGQAIAISPEPASPEPASPEPASSEPTSVLTPQDATSVGITNLLFDMSDETNELASELSAPVEENDNQA